MRLQQSHPAGARVRRIALRSLLLAGIALPFGTGHALAQSQTPPQPETDPTQVEEVVVTGLRRTLQSSIERKREETVVADVLSSEDIGDLPALSIGEAIETITGASTHREKGAASEIAIRGLGPFLGSASFNGREASNGSGDRSVNFNAFPSELINTVAVFKTQRADFIEGGVSGIINMETIQPLDFGRRRLQLEARSIWADYDDKHLNKSGAGWRGTISYIDQFDLGAAGRLGLSVGVQALEQTNPEELFTSSSTWVACNGTQVVAAASNCTSVTPAQVQAGTPFYLTAGSRTYRQFEEHDERDALFAAIQWRPNDQWELAVDYQGSRRIYTEDRQDLNFSETLRGVANRQVDPNGTLRYYTGNSTIESTPTFRIRDEEYEGGGARLTWMPTERLKLSTDVSYSHTYRSEMDRQTRLRSNATDIFGAAIPGAIGQRFAYTFDYRTGDIPAIIVDPRFDLNRHENFSAAARVRRDEAVREDEISAVRFDAEYGLDGWLTTVQAGVRLSERNYDDFDDRVEINNTNTTAIRNANLACRRPFAQRDFLSNASGNTVTSWAQFDALCLFNAFTGVDDTGRNADVRNIANRDVNEKVTAAYVLGEFDTALMGLPLSGNLGVRYVQTEVESLGLRGALDVINNPDGTVRLVAVPGQFETLTFTGESKQWLPSFNANLSLRDDLALRLGLFRAMSRPDPSSLGAGRSFTLDSGAAFTSVEDAIASVAANGNPAAEPLLSWNGDLSLEWYPNRDSIFSAAVYYKVFNGGFAPVVRNESFTIDGVNATLPVVVDTATDDTSTLKGFELTAAHTFAWLPQPLDGLGVKLSYNYADSDYETQDIRLGAIYDPVTNTTTPAIVPPAGIFGLSKHVFSGQLFYEIGPIELQGIYKYRSEYYQKFVGGPSQLRYIRDTGVFDFRATYRVNSTVSFSFEGSNLNDEPRYHDMPISGSLREYNTYGPRYYLGVRVRL